MATPPAKSPATAYTPEVAADGATKSELGDLLKQARERRGLSLDQVARVTKISPYHLEALERGTFINVPSGFYQRAQIRTYARAVDLDPDVALAQLDHPSASPVSRRPESEPGKAEPPVLWRKRAVVAVVVIVAAVAVGLATGEWKPAGDSLNDTGAALQTPQPMAARPAGSGDAIASSARPQLNEAPSAAVEQVAPRDLAASLAEDAPRPASASGTAPDGAAAADRASTADGNPPGGTPVVAAAPRGTLTSAATAAQTAVTARSVQAVAKPLAEFPKREATRPAEQSEIRSAAPPVSGLVVITSPPGARVTVNGIAWGVTPLTIRYLPTGDKRIRVSKDGYAAEERAIKLAEGRSTTVDIQLHGAP